MLLSPRRFFSKLPCSVLPRVTQSTQLCPSPRSPFLMVCLISPSLFLTSVQPRTFLNAEAPLLTAFLLSSTENRAALPAAGLSSSWWARQSREGAPPGLVLPFAHPFLVQGSTRRAAALAGSSGSPSKPEGGSSALVQAVGSGRSWLL